MEARMKGLSRALRCVHALRTAPKVAVVLSMVMGIVEQSTYSVDFRDVLV
jgi:hypothetical protein